MFIVWRATLVAFGLVAAPSCSPRGAETPQSQPIVQITIARVTESGSPLHLIDMGGNAIVVHVDDDLNLSAAAGDGEFAEDDPQDMFLTFKTTDGEARRLLDWTTAHLASECVLFFGDRLLARERIDRPINAKTVRGRVSATVAVNAVLGDEQ